MILSTINMKASSAGVDSSLYFPAKKLVLLKQGKVMGTASVLIQSSLSSIWLLTCSIPSWSLVYLFLHLCKAASFGSEFSSWFLQRFCFQALLPVQPPAACLPTNQNACMAFAVFLFLFNPILDLGFECSLLTMLSWPQPGFAMNWQWSRVI